MKKLTALFLLAVLGGNLLAQETPEKIMEKRAREMHRVIAMNDIEQWKKFIRENYSQALIDRQMKTTVKTEENGTAVTSTPEEAKGETNVDKKASMFGILHNDFGKSKISSLKIEGETANMLLQSPGGMSGTFSLKFSKTKPYLIEGLGIQIEN